MGGKEVKSDAQRVEGKKTALGGLCKESFGWIWRGGENESERAVGVATVGIANIARKVRNINHTLRISINYQSETHP